MTARVVVEVLVDDDPASASLADGIRWVNTLGETSPDYHEIVAHFALAAARIHWRLADDYRRYQREAQERKARAEARRAGR